MKELNTFKKYLAEGEIKEDQISPEQLEDMGYSAGEKALMDLNPEIFNQPYFNSFASGFIKGFQDNIEASQDYAANSVAEGAIKEESFGAAGTDKRTGQVIGEIFQLIRDTGIDPQDLIDEIRIEFGIDAMD